MRIGDFYLFPGELLALGGLLAALVLFLAVRAWWRGRRRDALTPEQRTTPLARTYSSTCLVCGARFESRRPADVLDEREAHLETVHPLY